MKNTLAAIWRPVKKVTMTETESPNQQVAGPETRMEESSKKRERELNTQVTGQTVAAAADQEEVEEEQAVHVSVKGSSTSDNQGKMQSSVKKSRKNLLEQSTYPNTRSSKNQKMSTPEIEETLPNSSNKFRKENSSNPSSLDERCVTSILMNSTDQGTDCAIAKRSTIDTSRNLQLAGSPNKGQNSVVRLCAKSREAVSSPVEHLTLHYQVRHLDTFEKSKLHKLQQSQGELSSSDDKKYKALKRATEKEISRSADVILGFIH